MNDIIRLAIYGQIASDTTFGFTYPEPFNPAIPKPSDQWLNTIADPRDVRVFATDKAYSLWKSECGNYYAKIVPSKTDTRNGKLMLVLFIGKNKPTKGEAILNALDQLTTLLIDEGRTADKTAIDAILKGLQISLTADYATTSAATAQGKIFRTYQTRQELATILQFPNQAEYNGCKNLLIVPAQSVQPGIPLNNLRQISSPILATYTIKNRFPNVSVNKPIAMQGDTIVITYSKTGYLPAVVACCIDGKPNGHIVYNGTEIIISDPATIRLPFRRGLKIRCVTSTGVQVSNIKVCGDNCKMDNTGMCIFDADKPQYRIRIAANGYYDSDEIIINDDDFMQGSITVKLTAQQKPVYLTVKDIYGNTKSGTVYIETDDPLYTALTHHQGTIDLAKGSSYDDDKEEKGGVMATIWKFGKWVVFLIIAVAIALCIFLLASGKDLSDMFGGDKESITPTEWTATDSIDNNGNLQEDSQQALEEADIQYMKDNDVWNMEYIKSDKYAFLMDALQNQNLEDIVSHEYKDCENINGYWEKIHSAISELKDEHSVRVTDEIKRCCQNNEVNITKLATSMTVLRERINKAQQEVKDMMDTNASAHSTPVAHSTPAKNGASSPAAPKPTPSKNLPKREESNQAAPPTSSGF